MIARALMGIAVGLLSSVWLLGPLKLSAAPDEPNALNGGPATLFPPNRVGGSFGSNDQRDSDVSPSIAFDPVGRRYLAVWMSARNAGSSSDGLDVYGAFLGEDGRPLGSEFRVSDSNTAARNAPATVEVGPGGFVVVWAAQGGVCALRGQYISDSTNRPDWVLFGGAGHHHSPHLIYNALRQRYALSYVEGDDYLAPSLFGAQTSSCGNNANSTSRIGAAEFHLVNGIPILDSQVYVSSPLGSFRPRISYSSGLGEYLIVWEDRRNASGSPYRLDVLGQRLYPDLSQKGSSFTLAYGSDYTNYDSSTTWTPRPDVAASPVSFLAIWFTQSVQDTASIWSVKGRIVAANGSLGPVITVAEMPFAQQHQGNSPTGFLGIRYNSAVREYLVGITSHLESIWGYLSSCRVQRLGIGGQLLNIDGTPRSLPGVGTAIDYANDDQLAVALAANPNSGPNTADYLVAYGKHAPGQPSLDFDTWDTRIQVSKSAVYKFSSDVHLSTAAGFVAQRWATQQGSYWDAQHWFTGDFNGDGRTDLAKVFSDNGRMSSDVHLSTAAGFVAQRWATQQGSYWDAQHWFTGDFNGDGRTDLDKYWKEAVVLTAFIPASGGMLVTPDVCFGFPANTFSSAVSITTRILPDQSVYPNTGQALARIGPVYEVSASSGGAQGSVQPALSFSMVFQYEDTDIAHVDEGTLALYSWNGQEWVRESTSIVDKVNNLVVANPVTLGQWLAMGVLKEDIAENCTKHDLSSNQPATDCPKTRPVNQP